MKAIIISLNFHPGHVSHMVASYKQCQDLGYKTIFYVNPIFYNYLPKGSTICKAGLDKRPKVDLAIFLFPSQKNLPIIWHMKREGTKVVYIFHEPLEPMSKYRKVGFSYKYLTKLWIINRISALTVKWSDVILLPSEKAVNYYEKNPLYKNRNYHYLPLMYDDERQEIHLKMQRKYFSYIGTVAADHSFHEYLNFVEWAILNKKLMSLNFMISTKSDFEIPKALKFSNRVVIHKKRPLSDDEINESYATSYVVWNAYARTTQSGVLSKSFMFGTPALVLTKNRNEFAHDGIEIKTIEDNQNFLEIESAINDILSKFDEYSLNCRRRFLSSFYYKNVNDKFAQIIK